MSSSSRLRSQAVYGRAELFKNNTGATRVGSCDNVGVTEPEERNFKNVELSVNR